MPATLTVDPAEVQSITVDPSEVSASKPSTPVLDAVKDFASGVWSKLSPVQILKGMADTVQAAAHDPVGTAENFGKEVLAHPVMAMGRAIDAAKQGKYEEAAAHLDSALSPTGFMTEDSQVKTATPGQRATGYGELVGTGLNALATAKLPEVPSMVKPIAAKALDVVPEAVGDTALQTGMGVISPRAKNIMIALDRAKKARAAYLEASPQAQPPPLPSGIPPEILSRLGMTEADFKILPKDGQEQLRELADHMQAAAPSKPPPVFDRSGRIPTGNQPQPGPSEPLPAPASRQLGAGPIVTEPPTDTSGVIKGWQPTILGREAAPTAQPPAPAEEPPLVQSLVNVAKDLVERHRQSTNPFLQNDENAFETAARAKKVPHFAQTLHDGGIPASDMEKASDLGWDLATKRTNEVYPGSNHGIPSEASRALVIEQMKALEKASSRPSGIVPRVPESGPMSNPKALAVAQQLRDEALKPGGSLNGKTVTLKNGNTVVVKGEAKPDGTIETVSQ